MKQVSLREFQLRASLYLKDLPVVLTQYNLPRYIVSDFITDVSTHGAIEPEKVLTQSPIAEELVESFGRCLVPFCKSDAVGMGKSWNETSGEMVEVPMCAPHLKRSLKES